MNKTLFYHVYLNDDVVAWTDIVLDQMSRIENSGLLDDDNVKFNIVAITQNDTRMSMFLDLMSTYSNTARVEFVQNPFKNDYDMVNNLNSNHAITEKYTLQKIYEYAKTSDDYICYFHTKGSTVPIRHLIRGDVLSYRKYTLWRQYLDWGVLENWKYCIDALETHDIAGVNYKDLPSAHYSGNYWWTTSKHIRNLMSPSGKEWEAWWEDFKRNTSDIGLKTAADRFKDEQWACSKPNTKSYSISSGFEPHIEALPRYKYEVIK